MQHLCKILLKNLRVSYYIADYQYNKLLTSCILTGILFKTINGFSDFHQLFQ